MRRPAGEGLFPTDQCVCTSAASRRIYLDSVREVSDAGAASLPVHPGPRPQSGDPDERVQVESLWLAGNPHFDDFGAGAVGHGDQLDGEVAQPLRAEGVLGRSPSP